MSRPGDLRAVIRRFRPSPPRTGRWRGSADKGRERAPEKIAEPLARMFRETLDSPAPQASKSR
jgi:hypothetical protein